jgi:superfamily II DNA/RNA helicase
MGPEVVRTKVDDDPLRELISHRVVHVHQEGGRDFVLARFLTKHRGKRAIVFVNQSNLVRHLYRYLNEQGTTAVSVTQDRTKLQCEQAMRDFVSGKAAVLLTTDRAAAGIDLPALEWVLHYELPASAPAYVHRAGRTGRAGSSGTSVVFATKAERIQLLRIESELNLTFRTIEL